MAKLYLVGMTQFVFVSSLKEFKFIQQDYNNSFQTNSILVEKFN